MRARLHQLFSLLGMLSIFLLWGAGLTSAQTTPDRDTSFSKLTISPAFQEITLEEDQSSTEAVITLLNPSDYPIQVELFALEFQQLDRSGKIILANQPGLRYRLADFISFSESEVLLGPNSIATIVAQITNTPQLGSGGQYAALIARQDSGQSLSTQQELVPAISSLILLHKKGGDRLHLSLKDSTLPNLLSFFMPPHISLLFSNEGNVHSIPRGTVVTRDLLGTTVSRGIINEASHFILPENTREITTSLQPIARTFPIMLLTMTIEGTDDTDTSMFQQSHTFLYISLPAIIILVATIVFGVMLHRYRRRAHE